MSVFLCIVLHSGFCFLDLFLRACYPLVVACMLSACCLPAHAFRIRYAQLNCTSLPDLSASGSSTEMQAYVTILLIRIYLLLTYDVNGGLLLVKEYFYTGNFNSINY